MLSSNSFARSLGRIGSETQYPNPCQQVRESCLIISKLASYVHINQGAIDVTAESIAKLNSAQVFRAEIEWDSGGWHYTDGGPLTCQYVFVMDALNFCFWPVPGLEYDTLAKSLKEVLESDGHAFDADRLAVMTEETIISWFPSHELPLLSERVKCVRELGHVLLQEFDGCALNVVKAAKGSAVNLVRLMVEHFSRFRDTAIYKGQLVYFYKRAQILVADVWAAYGKQKSEMHPCCFSDIGGLTMFADYRVPQILRSMGILRYSELLASQIDSYKELPWGSEMEVELRAQTIVAVDQLQQSLKQKGLDLLVLECDWLLWQKGEDLKDEILPHHRTLSIYY